MNCKKIYLHCSRRSSANTRTTRSITKVRQAYSVEQVTQDELCSYLLSLTFQSGLVSTMEETEQMKKIVNAVIRKMLKEERMLTIIEDSLDPAQRILALHPNYED